MSTRSMRSLAAITCVTALGLAACGGDDDGGSASAGADTDIGKALAADMISDVESPVGSEQEARCWSGEIVDGVGETRLEELGVTPDQVGDITDLDMTEAEVSTIVEGMFDCIDVRAAMASEFEEDFGKDGAECVADEMDEDLVKTMLTATFADDDEQSEDFFQLFIDIFAKCGLPIN